MAAVRAACAAAVGLPPGDADAADALVAPVEAVGLDGDMLEAQAWAFLAARVARGLPTSAPGTTGAPHPVCGGVVSCPPGGAAACGWEALGWGALGRA